MGRQGGRQQETGTGGGAACGACTAGLGRPGCGDLASGGWAALGCGETDLILCWVKSIYTREGLLTVSPTSPRGLAL